MTAPVAEVRISAAVSRRLAGLKRAHRRPRPVCRRVTQGTAVLSGLSMCHSINERRGSSPTSAAKWPKSKVYQFTTSPAGSARHVLMCPCPLSHSRHTTVNPPAKAHSAPKRTPRKTAPCCWRSRPARPSGRPAAPAADRAGGHGGNAALPGGGGVRPPVRGAAAAAGDPAAGAEPARQAVDRRRADRRREVTVDRAPYGAAGAPLSFAVTAPAPPPPSDEALATLLPRAAAGGVPGQRPLPAARARFSAGAASRYASSTAPAMM